MRIDEFSNTAGIDGEISTTEQTQFLLFGFDTALDEPVIPPVVVVVPFTGGQSFRQIVNDLAGPRRREVVYEFGSEGSLRGKFEEDTIHGAYGITVVDGEIV